MLALQPLIDLLELALADRQRRAEHLKRFQERVWEVDDVHPDPDVARRLRDLAYDLDYFEPDERIRAEDPALFGDSRLVEEVNSALRWLRAAASS